MSLTKRIIPCLDVDNGRVVKGINFKSLRDAGDPVEVAKRYNDEGADEIAFLDITASSDSRETIYNVIEKVAKEVFIPLTVGGGVRSVDNIRRLLNCGADKISINTAAIKNPLIISEAKEAVGSQCIVVAIDAKKSKDSWEIFTHGGRNPTGINAIEWAEKVVKLGAGELLVTSMDRDGTKKGFDNELMKKINEKINVPTIASGGVGTLQHMYDGINKGKADAVLAASIFHFNEISISETKNFLKSKNIDVRS